MDTRRGFVFLVFILTPILLTGTSYAIPAFSRQYGTSCSTCHLDFPKLNDFGKAFKDAGFKFPKDDETFGPTQSFQEPFPGYLRSACALINSSKSPATIATISMPSRWPLAQPIPTFRVRIFNQVSSVYSPREISEAISLSGSTTTSASRVRTPTEA